MNPNAHHIAISVFLHPRSSGPTGDTKYDIFDSSGMSRAQMRRARTTRPKVRRKPPPRVYRPPSSGSVPGETV